MGSSGRIAAHTADLEPALAQAQTAAVTVIQDLMREFPVASRLEILARLAEHLAVQQGYARKSCVRIDALLAWDLISEPTYRQMNYCLNDVAGTCEAIWENRTVEMALGELLPGTRTFSRLKHSNAVELAYALIVTGYDGHPTSDWCETILARRTSRSANMDWARRRYTERRAASDYRLRLWDLHDSQGLDVKTIAASLGLRPDATRKQISRGRQMSRLRVRSPDPRLLLP